MFPKSSDSRLSAWLDLRKEVELSDTPFSLISEFWSHAPFTQYNKNIDQYNYKSWPTPWEIINENVYDDFTLALMMAYSVKYTSRYEKSHVEIRSFVNDSGTKLYNLVYIDNDVVLNYTNSPVSTSDIPTDLRLENLTTVSRK